MRLALFITMIILNLVVAPAGLIAEVNLTIEYEYYPVKPQKGRTVYSQMFKDSPIVHKNGKVVAITHWNIKYNIDYKQLENDLCDIKNYEVFVPCKTTLPRLISNDKKLNEAFDQYLPYLKKHERGHCLIALDKAEIFDNELKSMGRMKCSELKAAVKAARRRAIVKAKADHKAYDEQTLENRKSFHPAKHYLGNLLAEE